MKAYTVGELARLAGVTVRTLHHYHDIGLLEPAHVGANGYRSYGEEQLLRLQQVLIHRELGIPLGEIAAILDAPGFDRLASLRQQRRRLEAEASRYRRLVRTIDRTIAKLEGDRAMKHAELYKGFSEKQTEYEDWLVERYGEPMRKTVGHAPKLSEEQSKVAMAELRDIEQSLASAMEKGIVPEARELDMLVERHHRWVSRMWPQPCTMDAYAGLADIYDHPDFARRYETLAPGFARWLPTAMKAWARRQAA